QINTYTTQKLTASIPRVNEGRISNCIQKTENSRLSAREKGMAEKSKTEFICKRTDSVVKHRSHRAVLAGTHVLAKSGPRRMWRRLVGVTESGAHPGVL
ncbi:hypothetical protein BaRGS_00021076, partial [Batillaria attramentaria]